MSVALDRGRGWNFVAMVLVAAALLTAFDRQSSLGAWGSYSSVLLVTLATLTWIFRRSQAARFAGYASMLVAAQVAVLSLTRVFGFAVYQHLAFTELGRSRATDAAAARLLTQVVVVAAAFARTSSARALVISAIRRFPMRTLVVVGLAVFAAAVPTRDLQRSAFEVTTSAMLLLVNVLNVLVVAESVPDKLLQRTSAWMGPRVSLPGDPESEGTWDRWLPMLLACFTFTSTAIVSAFVFERMPHIDDSVSYLFHAKVLATGHLSLAAPPDSAAFHVDEVLVANGRWFGYGFPGWPAVLSLGVLTGVPWLVNPLIAGTTVRVAHGVVHRMIDRGTANLTALLLALSPWLLFMSGEFMPHPLAALLSVIALYACERSTRENLLDPWLVVAGGALGGLALVRPLDAALMAALVVARLMMTSGRWHAIPRLVVVGAVSVSLASIVLPYNKALTGTATYTPQMMWTDRRWGVGSDRLGFGPDIGIRAWDNIDPLPGHGLPDVAMNLNKNLFVTQTDLFGWGVGSLALVLLALVWKRSTDRRAIWISYFGLFAVGYSAYWFSGGPDLGARYWYPALLSLVVLTVLGARRLASAWLLPAAGLRLGVTVAVLSFGAWLAFVPSQGIRKYHGYRGISGRIRFLADSAGINQGLVFVRSPNREDYQQAFSLNNIPLDRSANVYAADAGQKSRDEVRARFPQRAVWIITRLRSADELELTQAPRSRSAPMTTPAAIGPAVPSRRIGTLRHEGFAVFLVAAVLLAPGMTWGIPLATGPHMIRGWDVDGIGGIAVLAEVRNLLHTPPAGWYAAYPLFHYLVQGAAYAPYVGYLVVTGGLASPSPTYPFGLADPVGTTWMLNVITRVIVVCMAAGVVALGFAMVRRRAPLGNALLAALAVLLTEPLVFYAHTGNLDVPVLFWSVLTLYLITDPVETLGWRRAAAIGAAAGVAVATKDQAYAVVGPALVWLVFRQLKGTALGQSADGVATRIQRLIPVAALGAASLIVFLIAGGVVLWPHRFAIHVQYLLDFDRSFANVRHPTFLTVLRPTTFLGLLALAGDFAKAVREALGLPLALLGVAAFMASARQSAMVRIMGWSIVGCFVLSIAPVHHMQYRYALFPAFALAMALGVAIPVNPLSASLVSRRVWLAAVGVALAFQGVSTGDLVYQQLRDARYAASEWTMAHMQPGDEVAYFGGTHQLPHLPAGVQPIWLNGEDTLAVRAVAERQFRWLVVGADYFSADSRDHSSIMPDSVWTSLTSGQSGYRQAAIFTTASLIGRSPYYLPYLNPPIRIFERAAQPTTPRRMSRQAEAPPF